MRLAGKVGFIGCGNMGGAIVRGMLEAGIILPKHAVVCDVDAQRCEEAERLGITIADSAPELAGMVDTLVLAPGVARAVGDDEHPSES